MAENKARGRAVNEVGGWRLVVLWIFAQFARLYFTTLRFHVRPGDEAPLNDSSAPSVLVIWHNRILFSPRIAKDYRNKRKVFAAISASRDGALISSFVGMLGIHSRRGSSSNRAMAVAMELMQVLKEGNDIAITPDGPRGPIYTLRDGAAAIALMSKLPVVLVAANPKSGWRANSWDGFYLPYPFTRVEMRAKRFLPEELPEDREECARMLRRELILLTDDLPAPKRCAKAQADAFDSVRQS